jgi:molecular chaperone GrpE
LSEDDPAEDPGGLEPEDATPSETQPEVPAADEVSVAEAYQQRARLAEDRLAEVLKAYREFRQETEAYRERMTRSLQRKFEQRHETQLLKFIDILDNFDRALEAAQTAGDSLVEVLILVRTQLLQMLQEEGLERIPVLGLPYDPHTAEAGGTVPVDDPDEHHMVMQEMLRGYRLKGRMARHSQVMIGEYAGAEAPPRPLRPAAEALIGVPAVVMPVAAEAEAAEPPPARSEAELTLDEIIARAEAREAETTPAAEVPAVVYDDLTELADVDEAASPIVVDDPWGEDEK